MVHGLKWIILGLSDLASGSPVTLTLSLPTSALLICVSFMSHAAEFILNAEYCPFLISIHNLLVTLRQRRTSGRGEETEIGRD